MRLDIGHQRGDGRYPVTLTFAGAPNAFGGFYPATVYRKLWTREQLLAGVAKHGDEEQRRRYLPRLGDGTPSSAADAP